MCGQLPAPPFLAYAREAQSRHQCRHVVTKSARNRQLDVDQREMQSRALGRWIAHYTGECSTKEQISKRLKEKTYERATYDIRVCWDRASVCDGLIRTAGEDRLRSQRRF